MHFFSSGSFVKSEEPRPSSFLFALSRSIRFFFSVSRTISRSSTCCSNLLFAYQRFSDLFNYQTNICPHNSGIFLKFRETLPLITVQLFLLRLEDRSMFVYVLLEEPSFLFLAWRWILQPKPILQ